MQSVRPGKARASREVTLDPSTIDELTPLLTPYWGRRGVWRGWWCWGVHPAMLHIPWA